MRWPPSSCGGDLKCLCLIATRERKPQLSHARSLHPPRAPANWAAPPWRQPLLPTLSRVIYYAISSVPLAPPRDPATTKRELQYQQAACPQSIEFRAFPTTQHQEMHLVFPRVA
jgi:hypothetical protein